MGQSTRSTCRGPRAAARNVIHAQRGAPAGRACRTPAAGPFAFSSPGRQRDRRHPAGTAAGLEGPLSRSFALDWVVNRSASSKNAEKRKARLSTGVMALLFRPSPGRDAGRD